MFSPRLKDRREEAIDSASSLLLFSSYILLSEKGGCSLLFLLLPLPFRKASAVASAFLFLSFLVLFSFFLFGVAYFIQKRSLGPTLFL